MPKQSKCHSDLPYLLRKHGIQQAAIIFIDCVRTMFPAESVEKSVVRFYDRYNLNDEDISPEVIKMLYYESTQNEKRDFNICKSCNKNCNNRQK